MVQGTISPTSTSTSQAQKKIMGLTANLNWKFSDKQLEMLAAFKFADIVLGGGAKGGGKSVFLCRWAFLQCAEFRNNKGFLGRKRGVDFNKTTLETWKR